MFVPFLVMWRLGCFTQHAGSGTDLGVCTDLQGAAADSTMMSLCSMAAMEAEVLLAPPRTATRVATNIGGLRGPET